MSDTFNDQSSTADTINERINLPAQGLQELVVRNAQGKIEVRATDREDVLVHADKGGHSSSRRYREASLLIEEHEGRIFVRPHVTGGPGWLGLGIGSGFFKRGPGLFDFDIDFDQLQFGFSGDVWFDIEIELPRQPANPNPQLSIRNASGEVAVTGVNGQLSIATASGDVSLDQSGGVLRVMTASGDASITAASGRLTAGSASGDITVKDSTLTGCRISTASGDHSVTAALPAPGPYRFETVSGDVLLNVTLPLAEGASDPAARLEFSTVSGDAEIAPPFHSAGRKRWESGAANTTATVIRVKTVSGDLQLRASGDAGLKAVETPAEPFPREDEMPTEPFHQRPPTPPIPPTPPTPPNPPFPSMSDAFAAAGERLAQQAEAMSARAMQQAAEAMERAAAKMRPLGTILDTKPSPDGPPTSSPTAASTTPREVTTEPTASAAAPATQPAASAPSPEEERQRLDVLQALERGEIDIDEAMRRLDALEPDGGAVPLDSEPETPPTA